ncbi:MAG: hypothetical protein M3457_01500, partial [Chloroflexota bacterium]|nr:hypothetical protein [Chloroflexota bacterium]
MSGKHVRGRLLVSMILGMLVFLGAIPGALIASAQQGSIDIDSVVAACGPDTNQVTATVTVSNADRGMSLRAELVSGSTTIDDQWLLLNDFMDEYTAKFALPESVQGNAGSVTVEITEAVEYPSQDPLTTSPALPIESNEVEIDVSGSATACELADPGATPAIVPVVTPTAIPTEEPTAIPTEE